jgi:hypothetical protein
MPVSRAHVAEHIRQTCAELREMATEARFEVLTHILGMAILEASAFQNNRHGSSEPSIMRTSGPRPD